MTPIYLKLYPHLTTIERTAYIMEEFKNTKIIEQGSKVV